MTDDLEDMEISPTLQHEARKNPSRQATAPATLGTVTAVVTSTPGDSVREAPRVTQEGSLTRAANPLDNSRKWC